MPTERPGDPLGVEHDKRKGDEDLPKEGPPVARMASTYGTAFATDEAHADELASDETDGGLGTHDGLGRPRPMGEGDAS